MVRACSHEDNRGKVCASCGQKIIFGKNKLEYFKISSSLEKLIQKHVNDKFTLSDSKFPSSICPTCRITLTEHDQKVFKRPLPTMPNYEDLMLPNSTRSNEDNSCNCYICLKARSFYHLKKIKGRGHKRNFEIKIDSVHGLYGASNISKLPRIEQSAEKSKQILSLCQKCYQEIGKGKQHACGGHAKARDNVLKLVEKLPEKQQEQISTSVIKRKIDANDELTGSEKNIELSLSTLGSKRKVLINSNKNPGVQFSTEQLDEYRQSTVSSYTQMKKTTHFLRTTAGRKSVPKNYLKHTFEQSKILKNLYKTVEFSFDVEKKANKEKRPVVYADAEELLDAVVEYRNITGIPRVKVMADSGQNFFKISMSVSPETCSELNYTDDEFEGEDVEEDVLQKKKTKTKKKSQSNSVRRIILICIAPGIKETYDNVKLLFDLIKINNISFKFIADFKLLLIINGQQTATSTFPCPYCFVSLKDLKYIEEKVSITENEICLENYTKLKTYGDLKKDYEKFCLINKNKKFANLCNSTVNLPIFDENDNTCVLEKCVIPELHVMQGFVNYIFWNILVQLLGRDKALIWPKKLKVVAKNYQGEVFEGNACRKLLKEADVLLDAEICETVGQLALIPPITALKAMNKIVIDCFSTKITCSYTELSKHLEELENACKALEINKTLKIHVLLEHLKSSLQYLNNDGLN